jgi:hypothetical protein
MKNPNYPTIESPLLPNEVQMELENE